MFILFWEKIRVIHFNFIISPVVQGFLWILLSHSSLLPNKRYIVLRELGGRLIQLNPTSFLTVGKPRGLGGIKFEIPGQDSVTRCFSLWKLILRSADRLKFTLIFYRPNCITILWCCQVTWKNLGHSFYPKYS